MEMMYFCVGVLLSVIAAIVCTRWWSLREVEIKEQKQWEGRILQVAQELVNALRQVQEAHQDAGKILESLAVIPALVEGLQEMCKEFARSVDVLTATARTLQASVDGTGAGVEDEDSMEAVSDARREVRELVRKGMPEEEAEARVRERRIYDTLARSRK